MAKSWRVNRTPGGMYCPFPAALGSVPDIPPPPDVGAPKTASLLLQRRPERQWAR